MNASLSFISNRCVVTPHTWYGRDTSFTVFRFFVCRVTGFSAAYLPIGVKFYTAVRPYLIDRLSPILGGIAPGMAESWASTVNVRRGSIFGALKQPIARE